MSTAPAAQSAPKCQQYQPPPCEVCGTAADSTGAFGEPICWRHVYTGSTIVGPIPAPVCVNCGRPKEEHSTPIAAPTDAEPVEGQGEGWAPWKMLRGDGWSDHDHYWRGGNALCVGTVQEPAYEPRATAQHPPCRDCVAALAAAGEGAGQPIDTRRVLADMSAYALRHSVTLEAAMDALGYEIRRKDRP